MLNKKVCTVQGHPASAIQNSASFYMGTTIDIHGWLIIFRIQRYHHITDALVSQHWSCLPEHVLFKITIMTYRTLKYCPKLPVLKLFLFRSCIYSIQAQIGFLSRLTMPSFCLYRRQMSLSSFWRQNGIREHWIQRMTFAAETNATRLQSRLGGQTHGHT